jgi:hypothetical protein
MSLRLRCLSAADESYIVVTVQRASAEPGVRIAPGRDGAVTITLAGRGLGRVRVGDRLRIRDGEVTAADPWRHGTRTILPRVCRRSSSVYASRTRSRG